MTFRALLLMPVAAIGAAVLTATALGGFAAPASADSTSPVVSITTPPTPGNPSASAINNLFSDNGNAKLSESSIASGLVVAGTNQLNGDAFNISIVPPSGASLVPGDYPIRYTNAADDATTPTMPSVSVYYDNTGGMFVGDLDILDLAWNTAGAITRFDVTFKDPQGERPSTYSGEIRMGETDNSSVDLSAKNLAWGAPPLGYASQVETEWLHNTSSAAVAIGAASLAGDAAKDYSVSANTCSGKSLAAGATCSLGIGYSPSVVGPRDASLSIPVGSSTQVVSLTGTTMLGTTSLTTSGNDELDKGSAHSITAGAAYGILSTTGATGYEWLTAAASGNDSQQLMLRVSPPDGYPNPLAVGVHSTGSYGTTAGSGYGEMTTVNGMGCGSEFGSIDVKAFALDRFGQVSMANITYTQQCLSTSPVLTGTLLYQWRTDTTAPAAPTSVTVSASGTPTASWHVSTSTDAARTVVRLVEGTGVNATPTSGWAVADGSGTSAALPAVPSNEQYTLVAFAVDSSGNVSTAGTARYSSGTTTPPVTVAGPPTAVSAVAGNASATISFTPPTTTGGQPITSYTVRSTSGASAVGSSSPITVTGLTNGVGYQFEVVANTASGPGTPSGWTAVVTPAPPVTATNLLPDPGFESGDGGWTQFVSGSLTRVSAPVHSGVSALRIAATSASVTIVGITQDSVVTNSVAGQTYTSSCWVNPSSTGLSVTIRLLEYTQNFGSDVHVATTTVANLPASTWTDVSVSGVAVNSGERIVPQAYSTNETTATGSVTYDDCAVTG